MTVPSGMLKKVFVTGAALSLRRIVNFWLGPRLVSAVSFKVLTPSVGALVVIMAVLVGPPPGRFGNSENCKFTLETAPSESVPNRSGIKARAESESDLALLILPPADMRTSI